MKTIIKKGSKFFAAMLVVTVLFTIGFGKVSAAVAPKNITVKRAEVLADIISNNDHGFTVFTTADGKYVYCLDVDKKPLVSGQGATLNSTGDAGLLWILQNGYPNKEITGNAQNDKYITQALVWWYMDETGQGAKLSNDYKNSGKDTDYMSIIPKYIKPMVAKAKAAKNTQAKPSMNITANGTTLTLTKDGKYYESSYMSASLVGTKTYSASVTGGTKNTVLVDDKGNVKNTFNSSERFKVRIPAGEITQKATLTVKFSATGSVQAAKIYSTGNSAYQRVIGLYEEQTPLAKSTGFTVDPKHPDKHVCEFTDNKYYGKNGTVVDKKTYTKECESTPDYHVCEVVNNKYYGSEGKTVDKATFESQCGEVVVVPNTSSNVSALVVVGGLLVIAAGAGFIIYRKKNILS